MIAHLSKLCNIVELATTLFATIDKHKYIQKVS